MPLFVRIQELTAHVVNFETFLTINIYIQYIDIIIYKHAIYCINDVLVYFIEEAKLEYQDNCPKYK